VRFAYPGYAGYSTSVNEDSKACLSDMQINFGLDSTNSMPTAQHS